MEKNEHLAHIGKNHPTNIITVLYQELEKNIINGNFDIQSHDIYTQAWCLTLNVNKNDPINIEIALSEEPLTRDIIPMSYEDTNVAH